jgi:hypothetical protein
MLNLKTNKSIDIPNLFGKILCGPNFSFRLEDYGYRIVPAPSPPPIQPQTNEDTSTISNNSFGRMDKYQISNKILPDGIFTKLKKNNKNFIFFIN